jgi:hypothetical protein
VIEMKREHDYYKVSNAADRAALLTLLQSTLTPGMTCKQLDTGAYYELSDSLAWVVTEGDGSGIRSATSLVSGSAAAAPLPGQTPVAISATEFEWGPAPLDNTPIAPGSTDTSIPTAAGATTALPYAVPPSTMADMAITCQFSANGGAKVFNGTLVGTARRVGSAAPTITQSLTVPLELTDSAWNPRLVVVENTVDLQVTSDVNYQIVPSGSVSIRSVSADVITLATARASVLTDSPAQLYYADTLALSDGAPVLTWPDASGNAHTITFASGKRGTYAAASKGLTCTTALAVVGAAAGTPGATGDFTLRWTMTLVAASGTGGLLFLVAGNNQYVGIQSATSFNTSGDKIVYSHAASGGGALGTGVAGTHDYELRVNKDGGTGVLYIDGAAGTAFTGVTQYALTGTFGIGLTGQTPANCVLHGYAVQASVGTDAQMDRWIAMSAIAWPR